MHRAFAFLIIFLMASCSGDSNVQIQPVNSSWDKKNALSFEFDVKDAQNPKNIIFVVRNNDDYPYSNLWLISSLSNKKTKKAVTDSLNFILAEPNGKWIGSGFGETKEILFQYKTNFKFPENGKYTISVQQGMRKNPLPGIEDLGIKIENAKP